MRSEDMWTTLLYIVLKVVLALFVMLLGAGAMVKLNRFGKRKGEYLNMEVTLEIITGILLGIGVIIAVK